MKKLKERTPHSMRSGRRKTSETDWYFIGGKWFTAEERQAEMSRLKAKISEIEETLTICGQAFKLSADLIRLARTGHQLPVEVLLWITFDMVGALNSIAEKQPQLVLETSRSIFAWPAFISRKRAGKLDNAKLMDTLQLGEGGPYSKRQWQLSAPSTQYALRLFVTAQLNQKAWDLPPLTEKSKRTWFEASWKEMLRVGIVPEEAPFLAQLGKSAIGKRSISRGMSKQTEGMKRDDVRAEIKRQLWNSFDRLVAAAEK
jgi:hypothetical protein